ncbi:hypothetical protein TMatcc_004556 [Talaromyces marneffei ATCC 18224]|uniref:Siderophore biosynthesis lipase/esterase n=1 Tax=Talaromyces marneffei (strain ATCC 18224 / CBS 334.59 / QM 7333) TaxID=441960 RepID=B6Q3X2_TALMQ|nr:conserved hypothetical protein [Talaromyces marneffei ATCC 18224]KAE8557121.1 hypothetical protein EYB25_001827 [Talaromyces marneffei]
MGGFHGVVGTQDAGKVHHVTERLVAFEYITSSANEKPHSLVFIGGLGDGLCTVPYLKNLSAGLESTEWSLFSFIPNSAYDMWGTGRLGQDIEDIAQCIEYITNYKKQSLPASQTNKSPKIVIMGHSTGSQDVLHYLYSPNPLPTDTVFDKGLRHIDRPALDGAIMQAPVSDREAILDGITDEYGKFRDAEVEGAYLQLVEMAKTCTYSSGNAYDVILPLSMTARIGYPLVPLTARRFLSLASPDGPENPGEDDVFSSDLSDKRLQETFGMIATRDLLKTKLLVVYSGSDEYVPKKVDKVKLLERWKAASNKSFQKVWDDENSGIVPGASHNIGGDGEGNAREDLVKRVKAYLKDVASATT